MDIYLPIAEVSVNWPLLVLLGATVGFVSGLFGIGGGFLMAPILIFLGIPPAVAVSYLLFLGVIGTLMLYESLGQILRRVRGEVLPHKERRRPLWLYGLPLKMRFPRSGLYISAIPPFALGAFAGVLSAIMGVGGGFILVPAMLYVLRMRAGVVVGTSLFQIIIVTAMTTVLQAGRNQTVDIVLSTLLLVGGVVGAQYGARLSGRFRPDVLRAVLGLIVLLVGIQMGLELFVRPSDLFAFAPGVPE